MGTGTGVGGMSVAVGVDVFVGLGLAVLVGTDVWLGTGVAVAANAPPLHDKIINAANNINIICLNVFFSFIIWSFHHQYEIQSGKETGLFIIPPKFRRNYYKTPVINLSH
jgi:hypothetical protein